MAKLLRKALGLFVELNDDNEQAADTTQGSNVSVNTASTSMPQNFRFHNEDLEKFEAHFEQLMDKANLPGPDYYEFCKMMEALEPHVPDEKARIGAVFASLSVQGMTKEKLVSTALQYKDIINSDHDNFNNALNQKSSSDIEEKKQECTDLQKKISDNSDMIQKLTKEITDSQVQIGKLTQEITDSESKLENNKKGYEVAYNAMINKINTDIKDIQTSI